MCGIIAVLRRRAVRLPPTENEIRALLEPTADRLRSLSADDADLGPALHGMAEVLDGANVLLQGVPGLLALRHVAGMRTWLDGQSSVIWAELDRLEAALDASGAAQSSALERVNSGIIACRDMVWAIQRDRLRTAALVDELAGPDPTLSATETFLSVQQALSALDRLEVRGRDSAGLHLQVRGHALDLGSAATRAALADRAADPLFQSSSVRVVEDHLSFVYKAAAEIGELGDNTRAIRQAIRSDQLLRQALQNDRASTVVIGHTRWASVGIISEPNAHPLNSEELDRVDGPYCIAALNGDVDNFGDLIAADDLRIAGEITTDAKVIPALLSRHLADGHGDAESFRRTVSVFEGSVAIAASTVAAPDRMQLALRGSGQALYVGLAEDLYVVASEPYGVVEETRRFVRMDGETPGNPANPVASQGQLVVLDGSLAGTLGGIDRRAYDGTVLSITAGDVVEAQITTRDIDRGDYPHFLLKEISEAPSSFRKTLRGKLVDVDGEIVVRLGEETLPPDLVDRLRARRITEVLVIGQGTAAIAGQSLAVALEEEIGDLGVRVLALPATELSGFGLRPDMSSSLVIAISQSGTTTDTNRTVDLVRGRGAAVLAIVNRRNSDLTDKVDGVLYTSDGRDVEMSVASTKAFYSQIAAGLLLAVAVGDLIRGRAGDPRARQSLLGAIRHLPNDMQSVIERRALIRQVAERRTPSRRYWAVVGNGANLIAARELRIKLSELCYKSIAADVTEDKKHIDLSSEPFILVCAAGLTGSTADDVAKEIAIYRAHKAVPVVIADENEGRFGAAHDVLPVPSVHPRLAFVLSTVVGHLFGYEAARAIDAQAQPLREVRAAIEHAAVELARGGDAAATLAGLRPQIDRGATVFFDELRREAYNGHLEASTAVRLAALLRYALDVVPLESYQIEFGKIGTPSVVLDDLVVALTRAIEELTRPIDAIKHQAKTVTVGISRTDESLLQGRLPMAVLEAGAPRDRLSYKTLRTLAGLDPAVEEVLGFTRYAIEFSSGDPAAEARAVVVDRGGISLTIPSRTDRSQALRGTKHQVAVDRQVLVARGRSDGRTIVIVPEVKDNVTVGLTLVHVRFADRLPVDVVRGVLQGYRNRLSGLRDIVLETEPTFREDLLAEQSVADLLTLPALDLADRWRG